MAGWRRWAGRLIALTAVLATAVLFWAVQGWHSGRLPPPELPARWQAFNPWAPLRLADAPNALTRYKLDRLSQDAPACLAVLQTAAGMQLQRLPDRDGGDGCGRHNALRLSATPLALNTPITLTCPAAVSLALWQTHVLQPAAARHFNQPVQRIEHFGGQVCRNIAGRSERSQHATAEAIDIAGFTLRDGRRLSVARDWHGGAPSALFLREVHRGACGSFDAVLGPDYNAAHADHFHLDRGRYRACR
jgi:hypothetical protein